MLKPLFCLGLVPLVFACYTGSGSGPGPVPTPEPSLTPTIEPTIEPTAVPSVVFTGQLPVADNAEYAAQLTRLWHDYRDIYWYDRDTEPRQSFIWYLVDSRTKPWASQRNAVSVSEGHGYGMLLLATMAWHDWVDRPAAKADMDAMIEYWKAFPSDSDPRLHAWQQWSVGGIDLQTGEGEPGELINRPSNEANSATDGDLDMAYALLVANSVWPDAQPWNYGEQAQILLDAIYDNLFTEQLNMLVGDWVRTGTDMYRVTRPSDFMIQHFHVFSRLDQRPDRASHWLNVANHLEQITQQTHDPDSGLLPDFLIHDAEGHYRRPSGKVLQSATDGDYYYDAARVPWRLAVASLYGHNSPAGEVANTIQSFYFAQSEGQPARVWPGYWLDESRRNTAMQTEWVDMTFIAPLLPAVALSDRQEHELWREALYQYLTTQPMSNHYYYGNSIRMLSLITALGFWPVP